MQRPSPGSPIFIDVAGRHLQIRYPLRILKRMEAEEGISIFRHMEAALTNTDKFTVLLYYGLITYQPDITREWVEDNINMDELMNALPYVHYAISGVWSQTEKPSPNGAAPGAQSEATGSTSGRADATTSDSTSETSGA